MKILFVDDDPSVLEALERVFVLLHRDWDITCATGASAALDAIGREPVDVVVSDMQMPDIDGATLLRAISVLAPATLRFALSGQANADASYQSAFVTHQFLSKPCHPRELSSLLKGLQELWLRVPCLETRRSVGAVLCLPSAMSIVSALDSALQRNAEPREIAELVQRDPALSAKVLQLVSSSYFGKPLSNPTISGAVSRLGPTMMQRILAPDSPLVRAVDDPRVERVREASEAVALRAAAACSDPQLASQAYAAGMLHLTGQLIESDLATSPSAQVSTHADIGCYLLGLWGISNDIVKAIGLQGAGTVEELGQGSGLAQALRSAIHC